MREVTHLFARLNRDQTLDASVVMAEDDDETVFEISHYLYKVFKERSERVSSDASGYAVPCLVFTTVPKALHLYLMVDIVRT